MDTPPVLMPRVAVHPPQAARGGVPCRERPPRRALPFPVQVASEQPGQQAGPPRVQPGGHCGVPGSGNLYGSSSTRRTASTGSTAADQPGTAACVSAMDRITLSAAFIA
jgi:hypothetical protein